MIEEYDVYEDMNFDETDDTEFSNESTLINYFVTGGKFVEKFTAQDLIEAQLEEPLNELDPVVYHDPPKQQPFIVKLKNTVGAAEDVTNYKPDADDVRIEGVLVPVVRLNTVVLDKNDIVALSITYTKFLPEITLIVTDPAGKLGFNVRPGLNNLIQVVIVPGIDGKYKKITLPFYITDVSMNIDGTEATYTGILKHMPMIQHLLNSHSILYPGCDCSVSPEEKCIHEQESRPNMWELFHEVAKRCELGFASMKGLKDYTDHTVRNVCSQNYKEMLEYNLSIGGLNETMIYDGWVDLYGYLILVDVYRALNDPVEASNLAMYAETGLHTHNDEARDKKYEKFSGVRRVLTNSNFAVAKSNIEIDEFYNTSNIGEILKHGTLNTIYFFNPFGNNGQNNLNAEQIRIKENSQDGEYVEDYEIQKYCGWSFVGCEEQNLSRQMEIRNAFLTKLRNSSAYLTIRLKQPNFALQRGTLVTVVRTKYDLPYKMKLANQESNIYPDSQSRGYAPDPPSYGGEDEASLDDILHNSGIGVTSPEESGIYYIDGMRFDYISSKESEEPTIQQYLYLIRRGPIVSLDNLCTFARFKKPDDVS